MEVFCTKTGLDVVADTSWLNRKVGKAFEQNYYIIGGSIIYSMPVGTVDIRCLKASLDLYDEVAEHVSGGTGPYVQIEDFARLKGSSVEARRYFSRKVNETKRIHAIILCNVSAADAIAIQLAKHFVTRKKHIYVAKHYEEAIQVARTYAGLEEARPEPEIALLCKAFDRNDSSLRCLRVTQNERWQYETNKSFYKSLLVDNHILHSTIGGYLTSTDVPLIRKNRQRVQASLPTGASIDYLVTNLGNVKGNDRVFRMELQKELKEWHAKHPIKKFIPYNANTITKTALFLAKSQMPFRIQIAGDLSHAGALTRRENTKAERPHMKPSRPRARKAMIHQDDIDRMMALVSLISWEQKGIDTRPEMELDKGNPLYYLYQSIKLIKEEVDQLLEERQTLEEQLYHSRKMESIGTLAGGIAHDFNNIMHIILGNAEVALDVVKHDDQVSAFLKEIESAGLRASGIVRQLLNFSRKNPPGLRVVDGVKVIDDALTLLRSSLSSFIDIRKILPEKPVLILADPIQIDQVLFNICINAAQAMTKQGGTLTIRVDTEEIGEGRSGRITLLPGTYLKISIKDTGTGMPPHILDKIFDPYFTTKQDGGGSGIGLAVVHGIVQNHNGEISVTSSPGKGSEFTLFFPLTDVMSMPLKYVNASLPRGDEQILFVDDEPRIVHMAQTFFERSGYKIKAQFTPEDALFVFQSNPDRFDMVVTDLSMPGMTGMELAEKIKTIRPGIPVIICTGNSLFVDKEKADSLGINGFVDKPISFSRMNEKIREILDDPKGVNV